jgi:hypothetical protein
MMPMKKVIKKVWVMLDKFEFIMLFRSLLISLDAFCILTKNFGKFAIIGNVLLIEK